MQPLQQQQQDYRLPTSGSHQQAPQGQPVFRPPLVNPGTITTNPDQHPPIRNIQPIANQQPVRPPLNQPQFRPGPPPQLQQQAPQQQQFQRPNFPYQVPLDHPQNRMQGAPVILQRQQAPDQKIIRHAAPQQSMNMTEINRERTFTTNEGSMDDDDNDVVVGRITTPQARPPVIQSQNTKQAPTQAPIMQRRESVQSIPSRPPSGMGSNQSQSPEPRMNPGGQFNARMDNRNIPSEMNRQSPNIQDYSREPIDYNDKHDRVQRPVNQTNIGQQQRSSQLSEENIQRQNQPRINRPPPPNFPQNEPPMRSYQETKQPDLYKQQNVQDNKSKPLATQDSKQIPDSTKPVDKNRNNSVKLDLSQSENIRSTKDKSPSSKSDLNLFHFVTQIPVGL